MENSILVAGGTGLVGANLTLRLRDMGIPVTSTRHKNKSRVFIEKWIQCDFRNFDQCLEMTRNKKAVVLCAGQIYGSKTNLESPTGSILPNLKISLGLLEASARSGVQTVILISSTSVYHSASYPIREDHLDLNKPPFEGYLSFGFFYRYLEAMAAVYEATADMRIVVFRPTSIYGPFDKFNDECSHVIPALLTRALRREDPFEVWGIPDTVRDFIYVEDFVDDIVYALTHEAVPSNSPINICSGNPLTIKQAVQSILTACEHEPELVFNSEKPSAIPYRVVDQTKYRRYFGNKKRTSFEEGIEKTLEWLRSHKPG